MKNWFRNIVFLNLLFAGNILLSQDIEEVVKAPWVTANGGLTMSHIGNLSTDSSFSQQPYSFYLSGNLNTQFFDVIDMPVSFSYTNNEIDGSLPQPFNRFSMSPSYKWIKTYMGYTSMNFSPYTLSGHEFLGGGVELTPEKKIKFSAMYGRLNKAVEPDTLGTQPYYKRMGGGFKADYYHEKFDFSVNIFKAEDIKNSLTTNRDDSLFVKPKDNISGSAMMRFRIYSNLTIMAEYALSFMNQDIAMADSIDGKSNIVFDNRGDISQYDAYKTSIRQSLEIGTIGATYERVSPNYTTLGAYYFNNDFENITADFSTNIIPKVNLAMNVGYQRDDLNNQETTNSKRLIYSVNSNISASKKLSVTGSVSNVQTYIHIRDIYEQITQTNQYQNLDTLSFTQLNFTSFANINYVLQSNKQTNQNLNAGITYQQASEVQSDDSRFIGNQIYNGMLSYQYTLIPIKFNISSTVNYNYNKMPEMDMKVLSINLSTRKTFIEKINASLATTYSNSADTINIINIRLAGGYIWLERHNFNLSLSMVNNINGVYNTIQYGVNFTYSYMFNCNLKRENKEFKFEGDF